MDRLGIGLIGTGYMGKCHALAWNAVRPVFGDTPAAQLTRLADISEEQAQTKQAEFGFHTSSGDWRDVIADPEVDVVSITTPNSFHPEMAIAAFEAGKHVWCEKPMATSLADAERMLNAQRASGKVGLLGYNYIQNPAIRHIAKILDDGLIGPVNHIRLEMDEDFMADPDAPYSWRSAATSGYGVIDDFGVHTLSLIQTLFGPVARVMCDMAIPYPSRPGPDGQPKPIETFDTASILIRLKDGANGSIQLSRTAWGRKGRLAMQIFGSEGSILFDQERMNEFQLYRATGSKSEQGFSSVLTAPHHEPYDRFVPAPGHGLGFNDLKTIECRALIGAIRGENPVYIDFETGFQIEKTIHAMAQSFQSESWVEIG